MIREYYFGSIIIDDKKYNQDVEVRWISEHPQEDEKDEVLDWERQDSHNIDIKDVERAVEQGPNSIVIGAGESGMAKVTEDAKEFIESKGIKLIIDITGEAVKTFNIIEEDSLEEEGEQNKVIGLFHLTC